MVGYRVSVIALALISALVSPMSFAKSVSLKTITVNQATAYGTIYSQVHFDERDLEVALKVERIIKKDLIKVVNYFQYVPKNTVHFNVDPYMRLTNGNARVFPTNIINLYKFPASNSEHLIVFDDWLRGLVFHEYTHIVHLDQTRGVVETGRRIFGNVAKILTSVVPRWFTEGIAVWSESYLMGSDGRLQNPLFRKELLVQFLRQEYCSTIDCLDEPGVYPGGSLAYWAGAQFIEYIEMKKPGAVKCLVENNSDNFPFFLNRVFEECTGNSAQNNFTSFRNDLINGQPQVSAANEAWGVKISNTFGSDDLQKGVVLEGNILVKVERDREREALVSYDLQENVNMLVTKYHYPISDLVGTTTMMGQDGEQGKYLIASFNEDPYFRENNRSWKLLNLETLLIEATLPFKNDPSYVIGLGNNRYLTASFIDNKWRIEKQRIDLINNASIDVEILHQFAGNINLTYFKNKGQKVFLKFHEEEKENTLVVSDTTLEKFYKLYSSKNYFDLPGINEKFLILRDREEVSLLEFNEEFKTFTKTKIDSTILNRVTSVELNDERVLVLENRLKSKEMTIAESMAILKRSSAPAITTSYSPVDFGATAAVSPETMAVESFPKLHHLRPYYWFLATGTSENLFSLGAMTTFSDPMDLNVINATLLSYPAENKIGGNLDFVHKFSSVSDLWSMNGFFNQEYTKTEFSSVINQTTEGILGTSYAVLLKRWSLLPGLYAGTTKTSDFISERTTNQVGASLVTQYQAMHFDDFFQNLVFQVRVQDDMPEVGDDFINLKSLLSTEGRFYEDLVGSVRLSYGRLYKEGFSQGVIYGGGTSSPGISRWHEFYGLPYSNAYGNEIFTVRLAVDYNFWYIYKGSEFLPVYFKEAHLLLGRESLNADRIILNNRTIKNKTIHSFFAGPRLKMNIFYYLPIDLDFIFSSIKDPNGGNVNQLEIGIRAEIF